MARQSHGGRPHAQKAHAFYTISVICKRMVDCCCLQACCCVQNALHVQRVCNHTGPFTNKPTALFARAVRTNGSSRPRTLAMRGGTAHVRPFWVPQVQFTHQGASSGPPGEKPAFYSAPVGGSASI
jgi:hypothetical protein